VEKTSTEVDALLVGIEFEPVLVGIVMGSESDREIMAAADKQVAITLAAAHEEAERTRGEGDSKRAILFAQSFGKDPSFAAFYRSMQAYEAALGQGDTTMVLSPDSDFFKYFKNGPGR